MGLPWVRLDSNIAHNEKVMRLLGERDGYRAFAVYVCALGWSGGQGTDGHVPRVALGALHGQKRHADLLVVHRLWEPVTDGWMIRNWADRQELAVVADQKQAARKRSAAKANCKRWHGPDCGCWRTDDDA